MLYDANYCLQRCYQLFATPVAQPLTTTCTRNQEEYVFIKNITAAYGGSLSKGKLVKTTSYNNYYLQRCYQLFATPVAQPLTTTCSQNQEEYLQSRFEKRLFETPVAHFSSFFHRDVCSINQEFANTTNLKQHILMPSQYKSNF